MDLLNSLVADFWRLWPHLFFVTYVSLMAIASAHLVMYKKDTRAAIGWIGVVLMVPIFGALLYAVFGINRLQRRALNLRRGAAPRVASAGRYATDRQAIIAALPPGAKHLASLERLIHEVTGRPLLGGNRVQQLVGGQEAYPQMLAAIDEAQHSVAMSTYIFDNDRAGAMFAEALEGARARNVEVRVIIDAIGARYSFPSIVGRLQAAGVPVARFLPTLVPGRFAYANLRNHRKILVTDGRLALLPKST